MKLTYRQQNDSITWMLTGCLTPSLKYIPITRCSIYIILLKTLLGWIGDYLFFHFASALFILQGRRNQKNLYYLLASKITKKLSVSFTLKGNLDVVCILFVTDLSQPTTPRYLLKFQHASSRLTFRAKTTGHFWKKEQTVNNLLNLRKHHMQLMTLVTGEKWKVHANIASNSSNLSNFVFSMF